MEFTNKKHTLIVPQPLTIPETCKLGSESGAARGITWTLESNVKAADSLITATSLSMRFVLYSGCIVTVLAVTNCPPLLVKLDPARMAYDPVGLLNIEENTKKCFEIII